MSDWDKAYLSLRRSDYAADRPTAWGRIEIPVLVILLAATIFVTFFWRNL